VVGAASADLSSYVDWGPTLRFAELIFNVSDAVAICHLWPMLSPVNAVVLLLAHLSIKFECLVCPLHQLVLLSWLVE